MIIEEIKEFKKTQTECGSVFLIDENLCLSNSYKIINHNIISLSSSLKSFETHVNYFNEYFTYFSENSAKYTEINNNIKANYDKFNNLYSYIQSLSSSWTRPISVFYNKLIEVNEWNNNKNVYPSTIILDWLNENFPSSKFSPTQDFYVYINLYQLIPFRLDRYFYKEYQENCVIPPKQVQLSCGPNTCGQAFRGCNHTSGSGKNKRHWCTNAYDGCGKSASGGVSGPFSCPVTGQKLLSVRHERICNDRHTCTSLGLMYSKTLNNTWYFNKKI
jgi:hypothetical protein